MLKKKCFAICIVVVYYSPGLYKKYNHSLTLSTALERPEVQCSASRTERDEKRI